MTEKTLDDRVIAWLADHLAVPISKISATSRIGEDFGVDGDDALELLQAYSEKFGVDCKGFDIKRYFGPEAGINVLGPILKAFGSGNKETPASLTVAELIEGARKGRLVN